MTNQVRPVALCVFRRGDKIFVSSDHSDTRDPLPYRPIGGGIEFGERAIDAAKREVMEEINAEVTNLTYLGTVESIFIYEGKQGHDLCVIFYGEFVDDFRNADDYTVIGQDNQTTTYTASWKPISYFRDGHAPLFPAGLLSLLE